MILQMVLLHIIIIVKGLRDVCMLVKGLERKGEGKGGCWCSSVHSDGLYGNIIIISRNVLH